MNHRLTKKLSSHLFKFLSVGGIATALQFLLLIIFVEVFLFEKVLSSFLSYLLAAVFNYIANYYFTFKSQQKHWHTLPKFILTAAIGISVNTSLFWIFHQLDIIYLLAQCLATLVTVSLNFLIHKYWIYRNVDKK